MKLKQAIYQIQSLTLVIRLLNELNENFREEIVTIKKDVEPIRKEPVKNEEDNN